LDPEEPQELQSFEVAYQQDGRFIDITHLLTPSAIHRLELEFCDYVKDYTMNEEPEYA
jgi:hypothetical protein